MRNNDQSIYSKLQRISSTLLINGGFLPNLGLYTGEMGLVLFFYKYARLTKNESYSKYSYNLLKKIQNNIYSYMPVDYKQGLTGIGSTIEYLKQNGYLNIDTDDILYEFDKQIFFTYNLPHLIIDKIADIGYYALWRIAGNSVQKDMIINSIIPQIVRVMEKWEASENITHPTVSFFKDIISSKKVTALQNRLIISNWFQLCRNNNSIEEQLQGYDHALPLPKFDLGIQAGLAGLGLSLISEIDGDDSWLSLFPNDLTQSKNESLLV